MQHTELLHEILEKSHAVKHKTRLKSLVDAVESVTNGASLSLTSMGRHMSRSIKPRSKIQEINYLLSNGYLHRERLLIYAAVNKWMIGKEKLLFIIVDWSSIVAHEQHVLRASLVRKGRSMTVYEEIHPEKELGKQETHQSFLNNLKRVLPRGCEICLIVDAGFKTDFYVQVELSDWGYVGRVLSNMHYTPEGIDDWKPTASLYEQATSTPETIGSVTLAKSNKVKTNLYLYKKLEEEADANNIKIRKIMHGKKEKNYSNAAKKPWLIASSFDISADKIMKLYARRMKIEHDFRDSKDPKWGLGIRASRSEDPLRLIIQLLIGFLASFILWLIGLCLEAKNLHRDFQANSIKSQRILSLVFLAIEAIRSGYMKFLNETDFLAIKKNGLHDETISCSNFVRIT